MKRFAIGAAVIILLAGCAPAVATENVETITEDESAATEAAVDPTAADLEACEEIARFTEELGFRTPEQGQAMLDSTVDIASPSLAR
jgi:hypothetical protein